MEPTFHSTTNSGADVNNVSPGQAGAASAAPTPAIREQDRLMPIANVIRIMRRVLPTHAKISDDAKETIQECVSEYISFITGEANERCQREQRKTITAEDVLWAMSRLGFDDYVEPLGVYLHRYREFEGEARGSAVRCDPMPLLKSRHGATAATMVPHHDMQMQAAMYAAQAAAAGASTVPPGFVMPPNVPHHQFGQYEMYGGDHGMAAYYAGMYGTSGGDGSGGGASASHVPAPAMPNFEHHPFGYK